jgi:CBS domain containing-hemolysin-like protein
MKIFFIFFVLIFSYNCQEEYQIINAKYYPNQNAIEYNGQKFILSSKFIKEELNNITTVVPPEGEEVHRAVPFTGAFWFNLIAFIILACFAGTMSGLTVGYLSIDSLVLEIKMNNGTESEKAYAEKIYRLVHNHHWLLVTLLLCNSFACEAMPIFLSKLVNEMMAVILSVTVLLFVGEIIPQALCTGPNQMKIASFLAPFTYLLMWITYPISYPIAMFMDYIIGVQGKNRFCNSDLKSIIELHMREMIGGLTGNQLGYFTGFLDVVNKKIGELIIPIEKAVTLDYQTYLTKVTVQRLIKTGFSRIPVYKKNINNLIGILRMKELVGKDLSKPKTLEQLGINLTSPIRVYEDTLFLDLFEKFKGGKSHMAFIYKKNQMPSYFKSENYQFDYTKSGEDNLPTAQILGIITLEDLIEFWLKIPILDEEDYIHTRAHKRKSTRRKSFLDIIRNSKLQNRINQLYDTRRASIRMISENNTDFNNNYNEFSEQKDEENAKLIFNQNN